MPVDDHRLEQALEDAAPVIDTGRAFDRVATKRARRRTVRRIEGSALVLAVVAVVSFTAVVATHDNGSSPHVAAPGARLSAHVVTGDDANADGRVETPRPVALDADPGVLLAPISVGSTSVSTASHDRGTDGLPLTHVVRINGAHVIDVVNFKAEIVSITEGEGARWALTRNLRATGGTLPDTFLKRIGAVGDPISVQLPRDSDPVGPIAAVGGAVWVPLRDGVLQFDPSTATLLREVPLPTASSRYVAQVGKGAYVTDRGTLRRLEPIAGLTDTIDFGPEVIGLAAAGFDSLVLLRNEQGGVEGARVARATSADPVRITAILPGGFRPDRLEASSTRLWVTGTVDGAPSIVLLGADGARATVVLENARDAALAWTSSRTVTAVTDGRMFTIPVP